MSYKFDTLTMEMEKRIEEAGVLAVLQVEKVEHAIPVAEALLAGGITAIELALRTPSSLAAIEAITKKYPNMMVGAGTLIEKGQPTQVKRINATFGVSPGLNEDIVKEAKKIGLPFAPGVATATEIEKALNLGCKVLKLFPAQPLGGLKYLNAVSAPYVHLNVRYIPLGGVSLDNLADYSKNPKVLAVGGSWIAPKDLINSENWSEITKRAKEAVAIWKSNRS